MSKWYDKKGNNSDVVLASRVRLARNLANAPFPWRMSDEIRKSTVKKLYATLKSSSHAGEFDLINLGDCPREKAASYAERLLISPALVKQAGTFLLSGDEGVSVMLCEEDHIRINSFAAGQNLDAAFERANDIDDMFLQALPIAYSKTLGFLTASPMNVGTGLKASFILHLPALREGGALYRLSAMVAKLGLNLRELYPDALGDLFVLSNQVSLGISEKSALDNVSAICDQLVRQERAAREELRKDYAFEDKLYRNYGVLQSARILKNDEFISGLSLVRLGAALGCFDTDLATLDHMLFSLQNSGIACDAGYAAGDAVCDKIRAEIVRERLG